MSCCLPDYYAAFKFNIGLMKTIEEKAEELYRSLDIESSGVFRGEIISLIIKALKEQDRDTRNEIFGQLTKTNAERYTREG